MLNQDTKKKWLIFGSAISSLASTLYFFLATTTNIFGDLSLLAKDSRTNNTLYLTMTNMNTIQYEILYPPNNETFLLHRYVNEYKGSNTLYECLLDKDYKPIVNCETIQLNDYSADIDISIQDNAILLGVNGDTIKLTFQNTLPTYEYVNINAQPIIPIRFGDYDIIDYGFQNFIQDDRFKKIRDIKIDTEITTVKRNLRIANPNIDSSIDRKCLAKLANDVYTVVGAKSVLEGSCSGKSVLAIAGTWETSDIITNIAGVSTGSFSYGFQQLKNYNQTKVYDICVGHSLGGSIARYIPTLLQNRCKQVATFGAPLSTDIPNTPITQYIIQSDDEGCCVFNWYGTCSQRGLTLIDPITNFGRGQHINPQFVGSSKYNCLASTAYTLFWTGFNLHSMDNYQKLM